MEWGGVGREEGGCYVLGEEVKGWQGNTCPSGINISLIGRVGSNHMRLIGGEDFKFPLRPQDRVSFKCLGHWIHWV